jgi:hypothetical protein
MRKQIMLMAGILMLACARAGAVCDGTEWTGGPSFFMSLYNPGTGQRTTTTGGKYISDGLRVERRGTSGSYSDIYIGNDSAMGQIRGAQQWNTVTSACNGMVYEVMVDRAPDPGQIRVWVRNKQNGSGDRYGDNVAVSFRSDIPLSGAMVAEGSHSAETAGGSVGAASEVLKFKLLEYAPKPLPVTPGLVVEQGKIRVQVEVGVPAPVSRTFSVDCKLSVPGPLRFDPAVDRPYRTSVEVPANAMISNVALIPLVPLYFGRAFVEVGVSGPVVHSIGFQTTGIRDVLEVQIGSGGGTTVAPVSPPRQPASSSGNTGVGPIRLPSR